MIAPELEAIRADFHRFIDSIEDAEYLQTLYNWVSPQVEPAEKDILDDLSPKQLERLKISLQQAEKGLGTPHEQVEKTLFKWYTK